LKVYGAIHPDLGYVQCFETSFSQDRRRPWGQTLVEQ
jgi:hypothetical protein